MSSIPARTVKFNVKFNHELHSDLQAAAGELDVTMADIVRDAIEVWLWMADEHRTGATVLIQRSDGIVELREPLLERLRRRSRRRPG